MAFFPQVRTLQVGGSTYVDLKNLIRIHGGVETGNPNTTLRQANGTSGYTPSGANNFRLDSIRVLFSKTSASVGDDIIFGYCDNDIGLAVGTAPVNPVYFFGQSINGRAYLPAASSSQLIYEFSGLDFLVLNTKFIFVISNGAGGDFGISAFGYEEP